MDFVIPAPRRPRRTQAERRAATRAVVLDATIDCLAEEGYAQTTLRRVAERAGVTPGALQHHFGSKVELLGEARQHLGKEFVREVTADPPTDISSAEMRNAVMLDRWWKQFRMPRFHAVVELSMAARTDEELRARLLQAERDNAHLYVTGVAVLYPELAERPSSRQLMVTAIATLQGLAMLRFVDQEAAERAWPATRAHLIAIFSRFSEDPGVSR